MEKREKTKTILAMITTIVIASWVSVSARTDIESILSQNNISTLKTLLIVTKLSVSFDIVLFLLLYLADAKKITEPGFKKYFKENLILMLSISVGIIIVGFVFSTREKDMSIMYIIASGLIIMTTIIPPIFGLLEIFAKKIKEGI